MSYFKAGTDFAEGGAKGPEVGPYLYKVIKSEDSPTNNGKPRLQIDIALFSMDKKDLDTSIRYISFFHGSDFGAQLLSTFMKTVGVAELNSPADLVGKKGVVLVGREQDYKDATKAYLKPAFGGIGCWFDENKVSATGSKDAFLERMSALMENPYRLQNGTDAKELPNGGASAPAQAASTPETDGDMPF